MQDTYPGWSADELLVPFRDWYFPGAPLAVVECEGVQIRTVLRAKSRAVTGFWPFSVYYEPLPVRETGAVRVPYLADVVQMVTTAGEQGPRGMVACPYVDWRGFASFDEYLACRRPLPGQDSPQTILRKARRIERELGPLVFRRGIDDAGTFDTLLSWKAAQYRASGAANRLDRPFNREFYHELRRRGAARASVLEAGGRVIAGKIGMFTNGRQLSRLTVYDHSLHKLSPGAVLELEALRASFESGDTELDFLMGDQAYKFTWATHIRWTGAIGAEPRLDRLARMARSRVGRALSGKPGANLAREAAFRLGRLRATGLERWSRKRHAVVKRTRGKL